MVMSDEKFYFLVGICKGITYILRFFQLAGFLTALYSLLKVPNKLLTALALFLGTEFILWLINHILLFHVPNEAIAEIPTYNVVTAIIRIITLSYLFIFVLKQSKVLTVFFTCLAVAGIFYNVFDLLNIRDRNVLEYVRYSEYFSNFFICLLSLNYTLYALLSDKIRKMKLIPLSLLFFCYFTIKLIYTTFTNFFMNQAIQSQDVFIAMLSSVIFDFAFYLLLLIFIVKKVCSKKKITTY